MAYFIVMVISRRLIILCVGLLVSTALNSSFIAAQQNGAQVKDEKKKSQDKDQSRADKQKDKTQDPITTRIDGPVTIQGPIHVISEPSADQKQKQTEESLKPFWKRPEWVGIGVGAVAAAFALLAFWASHRQAKAAERTLRIANRPWLSMTDFQADYNEFHRRVQISCVVQNPSTSPARLEHLKIAYTLVDMGEGSGRFELSTANIQTLLTPCEEYPISFDFELIPGMAHFYREGGFTVKIDGRIPFTDKFGKQRVRKFGRNVHFLPVIANITIPLDPGRNDEENWGNED